MLRSRSETDSCFVHEHKDRLRSVGMSMEWTGKGFGEAGKPAAGSGKMRKLRECDAKPCGRGGGDDEDRSA